MGFLTKNNDAYSVGGSIEELLNEAMGYGKISLFQLDSGFHFSIKFMTVGNISLEAKSDFGHKEIIPAIKEAIAHAKQIKNQFK